MNKSNKLSQMGRIVVPLRYLLFEIPNCCNVKVKSKKVVSLGSVILIITHTVLDLQAPSSRPTHRGPNYF